MPHRTKLERPGRRNASRPPSPQESRGTHVPEKEGGKPDPTERLGRALWLVLGVIFVGALIAFILPAGRDGAPEVPYSPTFLQEVREGNVARVEAEGRTITAELESEITPPGRQDAVTRVTTEVPEFADQEELAALLRENGVTIEAEPAGDEGGGGFNWVWLLLFAFGPILLLIGFLVYAARRASSGMGGQGGPLGKFGQSKARRIQPSHQDVSFADVAGIDEARGELEEIVDFLRNPDQYQRLGGRIPRGVLLTGAPGTGKTLLARAVAGEAGAPFFSISASEFVEALVGVGASRVRDMFKEAKKHAPAIVFIDELDAVGRRRASGAGISGGNDEREQTLNQILTEMDGFESDDAVIVIGATNRPDDLDEALLRPGRFDRRVVVQAPDREGRQKILRVHTRSLPLADDVDLERLAQTTPGMVGADLANLANEAALGAARRRGGEVRMDDFLEALEKIALGKPRGMVLSEDDRRLTAYHEAGHAIVAMLTPGADPVRKISIVPRGRSLGATLSAPDDDRVSYRRGELWARMRMALGGRVAEEIACDDVTTGAEDDFEQVTQIARRMVGRWGMSDKVAPLSLMPREGEGGYPLARPESSDLTQRRLDEETERLVRQVHEEVRELIEANREALDRLAEALLEEETLDQEEAYRAAGIDPEIARPDGDRGAAAARGDGHARAHGAPAHEAEASTGR